MAKNKSKNKKVAQPPPANPSPKKTEVVGDGGKQNHHQGAGATTSAGRGGGSSSSKSFGGYSGSRTFYNRSTPPLTKGTVPDRFSTSCDEDALQYVDDFHTSYSSNKKIFNQFKDLKNSIRGSHSKGGPTLKSQLISTAVVQEPVVKVLEKGFDLEGFRKPWCCFGENTWNGRNYAQGLSTDFSSPRLSTKEDALAGSVDFISDWTNVKTLYKAHGSDSHLSFLLHRIDNSVTIDHLDLTSVLLFSDFSHLPPQFVSFIMDVVGENKAKVKAEGRSNKEVLAKEAFHKTLHASMKRPMKVDFPKSQDEETRISKGHFLHHVLLSSDKYKILAGSDTPIFVSEDDEANLTVRSNDGPTIDPLDAYDLWLDNTLLKCPKTIVSYQKDWKITKSQEIRTSDLPSIGKFDLANYMEHGDKLLKFLKDNVKQGNSYWLYRAPGSIRMTLYNISNISTRQECTGMAPSQQHIFERWPLLQPYLPYFATATLLEYSKTLVEVATDKLTSETVYEPQDVFAVFDEIMKNASTSTNSASTVHKKAESGSKLLNGNAPNSSKAQKLWKKLELQAKLLQRYIPADAGTWIIRSSDEVSCRLFSRFVICIKGIYTTAIAFTPNIQNKIYRHAVELYFTACFKLIRSIGSSNERLKYWEVDHQMRQFMTSYYEGVCNILHCLSDWHGQVTDAGSLGDAKRHEWMYMACQMKVMYADTFSCITRKVYEKMKVRLSPDETLPCVENHERILSLYEKALDQIPSPKSFPVKDPQVGVGSSKTVQVIRDELLDEVKKKLSLAYLSAARFYLTFPPFFHYVVGTPCQGEKKTEELKTYARADDEDIDSSALLPPDEVTKIRVKENNGKVLDLLGKCIEQLDNVRKIDEQLKSTRATAVTIMGCMKSSTFIQDNILLADYGSTIEKLARSTEACLDFCTSNEDSDSGHHGCNVGGNLVHCETIKDLFGEQPVSDDLVIFDLRYVNGEAISDAHLYLCRAREDVVEGEFEDMTESLSIAIDAAFKASAGFLGTEGEDKCKVEQKKPEDSRII